MCRNLDRRQPHGHVVGKLENLIESRHQKDPPDVPVDRTQHEATPVADQLLAQLEQLGEPLLGLQQRAEQAQHREVVGARLERDLVEADRPLTRVRSGNGFELLVGPEGGFDDAECAQLARAGVESVRLGPRVLRTETAGPAALAALQALFGDLA